MFNSNPNQPFPAKTRLLPFYWRIVVRPNIREALLLCLLMMGSAALGAVSVGLTIPLVDAVMKFDHASDSKALVTTIGILKLFGIPADAHIVILVLLIAVGAVSLMASGLTLLCQYLTAALGDKLARRVKSDLFERFLYARYEEFSKKGRGAILHDINGVPGSISANIGGLGLLFVGVVNSVVLLGFMFYISWWATLVVGVLAIVGLSASRRLIDRRAEECGRRSYVLQEIQARVQVDAVDGIKVVKVHCLEQKLIERLRSLLKEEARAVLQLVLLNGGPSFVHEAGAILIVISLAGITFLVPTAGMKLSTLVAFLLALRRLGSAISSVNTQSVDLNRSRKGMEVMEEVLYLTPLERNGKGSVPQVQEVKLAGVSFRYASRPEHWALENIDLTARKGAVTALVGPTGSGKSTIASLVIGLYEPTAGAVLINGGDLGGLGLAGWRKKIGYVSQDTFLFNGTLRENIALWDETISLKEVEWAARMAQLHDFVMTLPEGYETMVGDRGLRLSGGQCQRVAIARAILRHPEVMIFDEATSALDNLTETAVYDAINNLREEAVVMVIAHRLSTIKSADQIIVLWSGRIIETGTHDALMSARGAYAKLYEGDAGEGAEAFGEMGHG